MNKFLKQTVITAITFTILTSFNIQAQQLNEKEVKNAFIPKGTYKAPFKKANEICLTSVSLQFKLATRQEQEKRGVGNIITWGFLEGIDDNLMQEITNEYYSKLSEKFKAIGISLSDEYKNTDQYKKLVENGANLNREVEKKNWGISKIFTANKAPYIEFPVGMMGPHASLGNSLKKPVGTVFITIDFINIDQKIQKGVSGYWGRTDKFETNIEPIIRVEGVTQGAKMRGDGSYALFNGNNWSFCNASLQNTYAITSTIPYAADLEKTKNMPESMKKFKSNFAADMATIFSNGIIKSGRGVSENTFTILANSESFKKAVLNALDKYNDYLLAYIKTNN